MTLRLVQAGYGEERPLVVVYHAGPWSDALLQEAAGPAACIVNDTEAPSQGLYARADQGGIANLDAAVAAAQSAAGQPFRPSPLVLAGFSEGCEGVRAQLLAGYYPDVAICADGIQVPRGYTDADLWVWRDLAARARAGERKFLISHAFFTATRGLPVVETVRAITGLPLPQGGSADDPLVVRDGGLTVLSADTDHASQGHVLLPRMVREAVAGESAQGPGLGLAAAAAGVVVGWCLVDVVRRIVS